MDNLFIIFIVLIFLAFLLCHKKNKKSIIEGMQGTITDTQLASSVGLCYTNAFLTNKDVDPIWPSTEEECIGQTGYNLDFLDIDSKISALDNVLMNDTVESRSEKINSEANDGDYGRNDSDLGMVTPHAIANAVAELVGSSIGPNSDPKPREEVQDAKNISLKDSSLKTEEKHNGFDEIEHLAEVEGKMRALRELFEAGLIAPEVYLLKAREYASEGL